MTPEKVEVLRAINIRLIKASCILTPLVCGEFKGRPDEAKAIKEAGRQLAALFAELKSIKG